MAKRRVAEAVQRMSFRQTRQYQVMCLVAERVAALNAELLIVD